MKLKLLILIFLPVISFGQIAMSADPVGGIPLTGGPNPEIIGNPYLFEDFEKGDIVLKNGETWKDWDLKIDLFSKIVIYKDLEGQLKKIVKPISTINFTNSSIPSIIFLNNNIYQVIVKGDISLLKRVKKIVTENKDYTSSSTSKNYQTSSDYFILSKNGELTKTSISKSGLLKTLPEYKESINEFKNLKSENDIKLLFSKINQR